MLEGREDGTCEILPRPMTAYLTFRDDFGSACRFWFMSELLHFIPNRTNTNKQTMRHRCGTIDRQFPAGAGPFDPADSNVTHEPTLVRNWRQRAARTRSAEKRVLAPIARTIPVRPVALRESGSLRVARLVGGVVGRLAARAGRAGRAGACRSFGFPFALHADLIVDFLHPSDAVGDQLELML